MENHSGNINFSRTKILMLEIDFILTFDQRFDENISINLSDYFFQLLLPAAWAGGYPIFLHIFGAYEPAHRCYIPTCDTPFSQMNESHCEFSIPKEHSSKNIFTEAEKFDPCHRFKFSDDFLERVSKLSAPIPTLLDELKCSEDHFDQATNNSMNAKLR